MNSDDSFGSEFVAYPLTMYVDALERDNVASARRQQSTPALQLSQRLGSHGDAYVRPLGQFTFHIRKFHTPASFHLETLHVSRTISTRSKQNESTRIKTSIGFGNGRRTAEK